MVATRLAEVRDDFESVAEALPAADALFAAARESVRRVVAPGGRIDAALLEREQHAAHGLAWLKVYLEAVRELHGWGERLRAEGAFGALEGHMLLCGVGEYLARMGSGIPMSQVEYVRPADLYLKEAAVEAFRRNPAVARLILEGNTAPRRAAIAGLIAGGNQGGWALGDETLGMIQEQFRRFSDEKVVPFAHHWHLRDELVPIEIVRELAELGVFGLTLPEEHGGLALGKQAMCVVTEELSRGYIGVGSLSTRSEIAGELIRLAGTDAQKARYLPGIASGDILPTAVFTEPNTGSDLASLTTRARLEDGAWRVTGAKTWITHAARADLMTVLCRTKPDAEGYRGLSMLLAEKPRGTDADPFPVDGLTGGEIEVLGYRGMKEYTLSFDGFKVPEENLLGGVEGEGFKQLMETFESARIQTAARAVGVARAAFETGMAYAQERTQFGKPLYAFPRVADKLAWMAVETMIARQLTLYAAREKDEGRRCDMEAGLAKLLGAQVAFACADNALQIHGGNGYALEYPISRIL